MLPKLLSDVEQWETQVSYVGKMKGSFVRFHGEYMNETTYGPLGEDEVSTLLRQDNSSLVEFGKKYSRLY